MTKIVEFIRHSIPLSLTVLSFVSYVNILMPSEIYLNNSDGFSYLFSELFSYLLVVSMLISFILIVLISLSGEKASKLITSIIFCLLVLMFVEGNYLYRNYGPLGAGIIDWEAWRKWGYFDILIWGSTIIIGGFFNGYIYKYIKLISLVIITTIIFNSGINIFKLNSAEKSQYIFDESVIGSFSKKSNVIVILLDEFQSDIFYELIKEREYVKNTFDGFIYYPDTISGYGWTTPSVPLLLTGKYYDNQEPFPEYITESYSNSSVTKYLIDSNYRVEIFPKYSDFNYLKSQEVASNVIQRGDIANISQGLNNSLNIIGLSLFRVSPHVVRKYIYKNNILFGSYLSKNTTLKHIDPQTTDKQFFDIIKSKSNLSSQDKTFKFIHLKGGHVSWNRDQYGNLIINPDFTRTNYKNHVTYKLKIISEIFKKLKELGVYDNSLIYLISDHGSGRSAEIAVKTNLLSESFPIRESHYIPYQIKARAVPLFMKKYPLAKDKLIISDKPIDTSKFPEMIIEDINKNEVGNIKRPKVVNSSYISNRKYLYYSYLDIFYKRVDEKKHLPPMFEFQIIGHSWLDSSWKGPLKVYSKRGIFNNIISLNFDKIPNCINTSEGNIYDKLFDLQLINKSEYSLYIKKDIKNDILMSISFNFRNEDVEPDIDLYLGNEKIENINIENPSNIINIPYKNLYISTDELIQSNNTIKMKFKKEPSPCLRDTINSIHFFELARF